MALTTLDPKTALIVIDLQKNILAFPTITPTGEIVEKAATLAKAFRAKHLPVVFVNVDGGAPGRITEERPPASDDPEATTLSPDLGVEASDIRVTKRTWGAFTNTGLHEQLQAQGVTQVVIVGIATGRGVESTARFAWELGYNVTIATDAITDVLAGMHENAVKRVFPKLGEVGTSEEVLALLH